MGAMELLKALVADYLSGGFELHPQIASIASQLGLVRTRLDAALKAGVVEGGLAALSPERQRDVLHQMLEQAQTGTPQAVEADDDAHVTGEPEGGGATDPNSPKADPKGIMPGDAGTENLSNSPRSHLHWPGCLTL